MRTTEDYNEFGEVRQVVVTWNVIETGEAFGMDNEGRDWYGWAVNVVADEIQEELRLIQK